MRILWLTPGFAANEQDFNCIPPLQLLARELLVRGLDLHIVTLEYPFQKEAYHWEGATVYPCDGRNRRWLRWRTCMRALAYAEAILREKKVDALHSFWLGPAWELGNRIAVRHHIPHITTLMGQDVLPQNRYIRRLNAAAAGRLVALTPFHNDMLEKTTGRRAAYQIPWGVEPVAETGRPRTLDVLGVGSLLPVKDWSQWLRVLRRVADERPELRAELIGSGPEAKQLHALARNLGLEQTVQFTGALPRPQVLARMCESRVLLHTARFESFGMVLAEAAARGCRVVSTPVGVAPQIALCAATGEALAGTVSATLERPAPAGAVVPHIADVASVYVQIYQKR